MRSIWTTWTTPLLALGFDIKAHESQLERDIIQPAISAIVDFSVSEAAAGFNPLPIDSKDQLHKRTPRIGWDSSIRKDFDSIEPVLPFRNRETTIGIMSETNPEFHQEGLIVFERNRPDNAYEVKIKRSYPKEKHGTRIALEIHVIIPDESVFESDWFRLQHPE